MKLTPFKRWTIENFPFIEADFDAITNYQLYCKIVEYLNKVIDSQNATIEQVEAMQEYLDNLDIQTEVNNKLDEMATDGTLADLINQEIFTELNNKVNSLEDSIDDIEENINTYPYYDILENGGHDDGETANDTILNSAKNDGYRKFYFPQNSTNNAVYYFSSQPAFNDCEIMTDNNVVISVPSGNNLNTGVYNTNIKFYFRTEQLNMLLPKNKQDLFNMLQINADYTQKDFGVPDGLANSSYKLFRYYYGSTYLYGEVTKTDFYNESDLFLYRKSSSTNGYFNGLCIPMQENRNCIETCTVGNSTNPRFAVLNSTSGSGIYAGYDGSKCYVYSTSATATNLSMLNITKHNLLQNNSNNDFTKPMQFKMRYIKKDNKIQFIINNFIIGEIVLTFTPDYWGFGIEPNNETRKMQRYITYNQNNLPINSNVNILIVGDSRFAGDGQTYKIDEILKNGLIYNGINSVNIDNQAVSGYSLNQIYTLLGSLTLSNYDIIIFEGGINNYTSTQSSIAYTLADIQNLLKDSGALVIYTTCMPCAFGGSDAHATDRANVYYGIVSAMNLGIGSLNDSKCIVIDNNLGNQKYISNTPVCSDGVHPNVNGLIAVTRNIISALFNYYNIK